MPSRKRKQLFVDSLEDRRLLAADVMIHTVGDASVAQYEGEMPFIEECWFETVELEDPANELGDGADSGSPEGADVSVLDGTRFDTETSFELPGEGGEYYTGGFMDLSVDGTGSILPSGDIAYFVTDYSVDGNNLTVVTHFGETFEFMLNEDGNAVDVYGNVWHRVSEIGSSDEGDEETNVDPPFLGEIGIPDDIAGGDETTATTGEVPDGALVDEGEIGIPDDIAGGDETTATTGEVPDGALVDEGEIGIPDDIAGGDETTATTGEVPDGALVDEGEIGIPDGIAGGDETTATTGEVPDGALVDEGEIGIPDDIAGGDETTATTGEVPDGALVDEGESVSPGISGDVNGDGVVNAADLNMIAAEWGNNVADSPLDLNGDGWVNAGDLNILATNWLK